MDITIYHFIVIHMTAFLRIRLHCHISFKVGSRETTSQSSDANLRCRLNYGTEETDGNFTFSSNKVDYLKKEEKKLGQSSAKNP